MTTKRPSLPGANILFGDRPKAEPAATPAVKHDEKITVYWTTEQLAELDAYRLELRKSGTKVDRGLMIRAAVAMALDDPAGWARMMEAQP